MCGICGIIRFDGRPVDREALSSACVRLRHRGPDAQDVWVDLAMPSVGLGATRLAVLDPTHVADQPMHREGRFHLVYNGEIYNFREIREELREAGDAFVTDGDTEVVLAACARWGVDAFHHFNGMWALCFYDSRTRTGFLSRDRFGVKPLVYSADGRALRFASEFRGLTAFGEWDHGIDDDAVAELLTFGFIAHPRTIYAAARKLPPGHYLSFNAQGASEPERFYRLPASPTGTMDYSEARQRLRRALADATAIRKVSDVPIGAFLSGGVDSSIITHHLIEAVGRPVNTFSIGFADAPGYDESSFARLAAERLGSQHHELQLSKRDVLDAIPDVLDHLSEPFGDSSILPTALLSGFAREHVTVALSGDAGDELFGGYWRYLGHESLRTFERAPAIVRHGVLHPLVSLFGSSRSSGLKNRARQFDKLLRASGGDGMLGRHIAWMRILSDAGHEVLKPAGLRRCLGQTLARAEEVKRTGDVGEDLNRVFAFDLQYSLPGDMLQKVDAASMMHSLEVRVPFLDPRVVELALALPSEYKVYRGLRKRVLIDAYRGHLPDEILDRPKQGFEAPIGELFRGPLRSLFHDVVTPKTLSSFGGVSYAGVEALYRDHVERGADNASVFFAILSLCWWKSRSDQP